MGGDSPGGNDDNTSTDEDWEACYGDWRAWEKKSKEVQQ